jgi:GNAT superfamily N-acetyltransferase
MSSAEPVDRLADTIADRLGSWQSRPFELRQATEGDDRVVMRLFDDAVRWLNDRGVAEQWGTEPFSASRERLRTGLDWVASGGTVLATRSGVPAGALVLGSASSYVPGPEVPEVYVVGLVGARVPEARGAGAHLLSFARDVAWAAGAEQLRVDCYAGGDGALVRFYESQGFERLDGFRVGDWPGEVLGIRV